MNEAGPEELREALELLVERTATLRRLRTELTSVERWVDQLARQADDLRDAALSAQDVLVQLRDGIPDLIGVELDDLRERLADLGPPALDS